MTKANSNPMPFARQLEKKSLLSNAEIEQVYSIVAPVIKSKDPHHADLHKAARLLLKTFNEVIRNPEIEMNRRKTLSVTRKAIKLKNRETVKKLFNQITDNGQRPAPFGIGYMIAVKSKEISPPGLSESTVSRHLKAMLKNKRKKQNLDYK